MYILSTYLITDPVMLPEVVKENVLRVTLGEIEVWLANRSLLCGIRTETSSEALYPSGGVYQNASGGFD